MPLTRANPESVKLTDLGLGPTGTDEEDHEGNQTEAHKQDKQQPKVFPVVVLQEGKTSQKPAETSLPRLQSIYGLNSSLSPLHSIWLKLAHPHIIHHCHTHSVPHLSISTCHAHSMDHFFLLLFFMTWTQELTEKTFQYRSDTKIHLT